MNKAFIGAVIALGLVATSCAAFPLGIPTVIVANGSVTNSSAVAPATDYKVSGTISVRPQKGSPGGTLISLETNDGKIIPGTSIAACPSSSATECAATSVPYNLSYATEPADGSVKITYINVQALSGDAPARLLLSGPITIK